jgi:ComF family protein
MVKKGEYIVKNGEDMVKKGEDMVKKGEYIVKNGEDMVKKEKCMVKKEGDVMKKGEDVMKKGGGVVKCVMVWGMEGLRSLVSLFFPPLCVGCGEALAGGEAFLCGACLADLPERGGFPYEDNAVYRQLAARFAVRRAASFLHYGRGGLGQKVVGEIKYRGNTALGVWMGERMAGGLVPSGFFAGVDVLVPVPLHGNKRRRRGFNQSEVLVRGVAAVTGIPVDTVVLYRAKANVSQVRKDASERWVNAQGLFGVREAERFRGQHILLVDDVLTTGATLEACAEALSGCEGARISVLTLAATVVA